MSLDPGWWDGLTIEEIYARGREEFERLARDGEQTFITRWRVMGWSDEQIAEMRRWAREEVRHAADVEAFVRARMRDPNITVEDECTAFNPFFTAQSVADVKRAAQKAKAAL